MLSVGFNPLTERWIVWNDDLCKPHNGLSYETEAEAIAAMRKIESRIYSHNPLPRRDSYYDRVLMTAH